jgi:hypothetical protein
MLQAQVSRCAEPKGLRETTGFRQVGMIIRMISDHATLLFSFEAAVNPRF